MYVNDVIRDFPTLKTHAIRQFCIEWAAMAIMMHNMSKLYWGKKLGTLPENNHLRLSFDADPLSCVIALADIIEDFERPSVNFWANGNTTAIAKYDNHCKYTRLEWENDTTIKLSYKITNRNARAKKSVLIKKDNLEYFDLQFNPAIKKKSIYELATCRFIEEVKDLLFLGPPGVGKSHLVQAIGWSAIKLGYRVLYRSIFDTVREFLRDHRPSAAGFSENG